MSAPAVQAHLERVFRAWDYARVDGSIDPSGATVLAADLVDAAGRPVAGSAARLQPPAPEGTVRFSLSFLAAEDLDLIACRLRVSVAGAPVAVELTLAGRTVHGGAEDFPLLQRFRALVAAHPAPRMLEVGGRARSGVLRRDVVGPVAEYVGLDVLDGDGVDVVADAHHMAAVLGRERFDFACSFMVWEHLAMPWKVVVELNHVLVEGGYAYIVAPQTCGMHDLPWDYFRFSDSAYRALFAPETGFEVVEVVRGVPMHVFPFVAQGLLAHDNEHTAGFFAVAVIVRKTGPTTLEWAAEPGRVAPEPYPA